MKIKFNKYFYNGWFGIGAITCLVSAIISALPETFENQLDANFFGVSFLFFLIILLLLLYLYRTPVDINEYEM